MLNSKLIYLLKTFSVEEMKEFDKFLRSPYFIRGKNLRTNKLLDFFKILKAYHPSLTGKNLSKEKIFERLYPGKEYDDRIMRNLISHLLRFSQKFLSQRYFESGEIEGMKGLLVELSDRKQEKLFDSAYKKAGEYLEASEMEIGKYYYDKYFMKKLWFDFYSIKKNVYKSKDDNTNRDYFFYYVILSSLRIYMGMLTIMRWKGKNPELILFDEIMGNVSKNLDSYEKIPHIPIYYNMIKLNNTGDEKYFYALIRLKSRHLDEISIQDRYNLFVILTNYCNLKISNGNESFREDRFILDKEFIQSGALLINKNIHVFYFNSAASNAAMIGEDKWAENFITEYKNKIEPGIREFAVNYLKALILFIKKDYDSALTKLSRINTTFPNQKQNIRNLMLQIYYDTGSFDNALSIIDTSLHFLKTEKNIPETYRKSSTNFVKLTSAIIRQKLSSGTDDSGFLKKKLESGEYQNRSWLFQKINELD